MAKHLIVCGHGAGDPGAGGNGYQEDTFNRNIMVPLIQKWAAKLKNNTIDIYNMANNMYVDTQRGGGAYAVNGYASVTELHLDAASAAATGGHVIYKAGLTPDKYDLAIGALIAKYVGLWGSSKPTGCYGRNDLLNMNVFASRGISYRLVEWGFITNANDVSNLIKNKDAIAKGLVEAITGETISGTATATPAQPTQPAKPSTPSKGTKINQGIYTVDSIEKVFGIWQVRCNFLVPVEFEWKDNGIDVRDIVLVDKDGYILGDQTTKQGSRFVFDTNKIVSVGTPVKGSGGYNWAPVTLKNSGKIWLSVKDKNDLINKVSND